jgi:hypothetical protein
LGVTTDKSPPFSGRGSMPLPFVNLSLYTIMHSFESSREEYFALGADAHVACV